jgi:hypothetical protein
VNYESQTGGPASATLEETGATKPLVDGTAVFTDLPAGTYTAFVQEVFSDDSGQIVTRGHPVVLESGDHAVITCGGGGCTGILAG